jgi:hypothetical protein
MPLTQKSKFSKQSSLSDSSIPFSVLTSPFRTVLVISAAQHQQAIQKVAEIDQEVKNAGGTSLILTCFFLFRSLIFLIII